MRSSIPAVVALAAWSAACSTPDRDFPSDDGTTSSAVTSSDSTSTAATSAGSGPGGGGAGGDAASSASSSSQGGGDPTDCGNGTIDPGEDCDETTALCADCQLDCPSGWVPIGGSCFAVALSGEPGPLLDAFAADARCGALDVGATGHRAHAALPSTLEEIDALGAICPEPGCWVGFYAFGPPGEQVFTGPATGETFDAEAPIVEGGLGADLCLKLLLNTAGGSGSRGVLDDQPCDTLGYFACELEPSYGDFSTCNDGVVDEAEECDASDSELCDDCNRQCPDGWTEDPRTHACLLAVGALATWNAAAQLCAEADGRLATPDEVADVRVASVITTEAWIGLEALGIIPPPIPGWSSGETFDYEPGTYPLPDGPTEISNGLLIGGEIFFELPEEPHGALCERFDPDE